MPNCDYQKFQTHYFYIQPTVSNLLENQITTQKTVSSFMIFKHFETHFFQMRWNWCFFNFIFIFFKCGGTGASFILFLFFSKYQEPATIKKSKNHLTLVDTHDL
jgi:hypothetical protein